MRTETRDHEEHYERMTNLDRQLEAHVNTLEDAIQQEQYDEAMRLLERNVLATFYGVKPDRLQTILELIIGQGVDRYGTARGMILMFPERDVPEEQLLGAAMFEASPEANVVLHTLGSLAHKRLRGQAHRSHNQLKRLDERGRIAILQFGSLSGWGLMIPVQSGITAMLSGHFRRALTYFSQAQLHPLVPSLSFLTRDAYAKAALLHAAFGDEREAHTQLEHAAGIPRTSSWAEHLVDATVDLAGTLLGVDGAEAAARRIDTIPMHLIGELWPFYLIALERVYERAGRRRELAERLFALEQGPLPRIDGESLAGSVFPVARATMQLRRGNIEAARQFLSEADPDYIGTQVTLMFLELSVGKVQQSLKIASTIGSQTGSQGMRRIDLWRYSGLASAYVRLDKESEAREALEGLMALPGGLQADDTAFLSTAVRVFAEQHLEQWSEIDYVQPWFVADDEAQPNKLSGRELEVMRLLAVDLSQQAIADQLFVSVNTLKTHIKAIYKKLDVKSRNAAVLRAEKDGLL